MREGRSFQFAAREVDVALDIFNAPNGDTFQQFKSGGSQTYSANFARNTDGTIQGQSRQFARAGRLRFSF